MRGLASPVILHRVEGSHRITLEVQYGSEPIAGSLKAADDARGAQPFEGYMQLIVLLEQARLGPHPSAPPEGDTRPAGGA
jgi:hypothetical protein